MEEKIKTAVPIREIGTTRDYRGYTDSVEKALTVVRLGRVCGLRKRIICPISGKRFVQPRDDWRFVRRSTEDFGLRSVFYGGIVAL